MLDGRIYVAGHGGLVGTAMMRALRTRGCTNLVTRTHDELDLRDAAATRSFFAEERPNYVFLAAARVGGIAANRAKPAEFIFDNLAIQESVIDAAYRSGVKKLLFLSSSAIYPRDARQPMTEGMLLTGPLEPSNEFYSVAKLAGIKLCQAYRQQYGFNAICALPTNLYGPNDHFDLESGHVVPAMLRRFHEAKVAGAREVVVWGTGRARREFMFSEDCAEACLFLMQHYSDPMPMNVGVGTDMSIAELAQTVKGVVGFEGEIVFDTTKPDGAPRKLLDVTRLQNMGWRATTRLREGLDETYKWYRSSF
ncbi:MAG TPA: GDP-L-fucose synthase [Fimbriimonas sp.]|nr:GDP-L-fucose synthase [Fimbriimonas sp.]